MDLDAAYAPRDINSGSRTELIDQEIKVSTQHPRHSLRHGASGASGCWFAVPRTEDTLGWNSKQNLRWRRASPTHESATSTDGFGKSPGAGTDPGLLFRDAQACSAVVLQQNSTRREPELKQVTAAHHADILGINKLAGRCGSGLHGSRDGIMRVEPRKNFVRSVFSRSTNLMGLGGDEFGNA